jgi:hypothetical protein
MQEQPFEVTDVITDASMPRTSLIVAALSEHYCALTYWQGASGSALIPTFSSYRMGVLDSFGTQREREAHFLKTCKKGFRSGRMHNELNQENRPHPRLIPLLRHNDSTDDCGPN